MKAIILAAGLGTRLKPWTLSHPKALVPVKGVPMLERVILRLKNEGFRDIVINVHHFAGQIIDFISSKDFGVNLTISDESGMLLDTGGGILNAKKFLAKDERPFLVHNVDILSSANLADLYNSHEKGNLATLLVSPRESSRKLIFDENNFLSAWENLAEKRIIPNNYSLATSDKSLAFSGIYVMSTDVFPLMKIEGFKEKFPIMDFFLKNISLRKIKGKPDMNLSLIDIGKPETLSRANHSLLSDYQID